MPPTKPLLRILVALCSAAAIALSLVDPDLATARTDGGEALDRPLPSSAAGPAP